MKKIGCDCSDMTDEEFEQSLKITNLKMLKLFDQCGIAAKEAAKKLSVLAEKLNEVSYERTKN